MKYTFCGQIVQMCHVKLLYNLRSQGDVCLAQWTSTGARFTTLGYYIKRHKCKKAIGYRFHIQLWWCLHTTIEKKKLYKNFSSTRTLKNFSSCVVSLALLVYSLVLLWKYTMLICKEEIMLPTPFYFSWKTLRRAQAYLFYRFQYVYVEITHQNWNYS